jgi:hypothetical protein
MAGFLLTLDLLTVGAALASAWLWWAASRHRVRRVSRDEVLDAADINRLVTALNRTQILSARGARDRAGSRPGRASRLPDRARSGMTRWPHSGPRRRPAVGRGYRAPRSGAHTVWPEARRSTNTGTP